MNEEDILFPITTFSKFQEKYGLTSINISITKVVSSALLSYISLFSQLLEEQIIKIEKYINKNF